MCIFMTQNGRGHLVVVGSAHMFSDQYLEKEENEKLQEVMWQWMTSYDITLNSIDADNPDVRVSVYPATPISLSLSLSLSLPHSSLYP